MTLAKTRKSKFHKVQFIYNNELHTHYVSHEEIFMPDDNDGDFVEPATYLVCGFTENEPVEPGSLVDTKVPKIMVPKETVIPVKD